MKLVKKDYESIEQKGLERSVIGEWTGWDELDVMANIFYDAPLLIDIGPYKAGDVLSWISFDFQRCIVEVPSKENEDESLTFQIVVDTVTVVE